MELLERIYAKESVKSCMIYGRRRIGKTSLILKFIEGKRSLFVDLVKGPEMRNARRIAEMIGDAFGVTADPSSLHSVLESVKKICQQEKTVIVFDELPYLIDKNEYAASELQHFVDWIRDSTDSMVIVCGSSVKMMMDGMMKSRSPLYGRFAFKIDLMPITIEEARRFHPSISDRDLLKMYLTLGGVTAYHDLVGDCDYRSAIDDYILNRNGLIGDEIAYDLQTELGASYGNALSVLNAISEGHGSFGEMRDHTGLSESSLNNAIKELAVMRIVTKMEHLPTPIKGSRYVISDMAVSFWSAVSDRNRAISQMRSGSQYDALSQIISSHLGRAFEVYCMDLISSNYPCTAIGQWWGAVPQMDDDGTLIRDQSGKVVTEHADIDIVATVRDASGRVELFGECKFTGSPMGMGALDQLMSRVRGLKGGFNERYALFSASGFTEELQEYAENNGVLLFGIDELLYKRKLPEIRRVRNHGLGSGWPAPAHHGCASTAAVLCGLRNTCTYAPIAHARC